MARSGKHSSAELEDLVRRIEALESSRAGVANLGDQLLPRTAEHKLAAVLIDALPLGVIAIDRSAQPVHVNPALAQLTGFSRDELLSGLRTFWPESGGISPEALIATTDEGDQRPVEVELERRSGGTFPVQVFTAAIRGPSLDSSFYLLAFRDLTSERAAQLELQKRLLHQKALTRVSRRLLGAPSDWIDEELASVLEEIGTLYDFEAILVYGLDGEACALSHHWSRSGAIPRAARALTRPPRWSEQSGLPPTVAVRRVDQIPEASPPHRVLDQLNSAELVDAPLLVENAPHGFVWFVSGEVRRWSSAALEELRLAADIVGSADFRESTVRALRESELRYRNVVRDQTDFIVRWKPDGVRTFVNDAYCEAFGLTPEEAIGTSFLGLISKEDRDAVLARFNALSVDHPVSTAEHRVLLPDGSIGWQRWTDRAVFDESGVLIEMQSVGRDVTESKRAEERLRAALEELKAIRERVEAENDYLREEVRLANGFGEIIGKSERLWRVLHRVEQVAPTDSTVLIVGETGTGKDLAARKIHALSARSDGPLVCVNCAVLPADLVESELFGHERGAFTGADQRRQGRFELAHGGTLFLDEVGELPLALQAKLLRVLQDGRFERLGGTEPLQVDVRVIAATNVDLTVAVERGTFRRDLLYRLDVFPIRMPPLRERREDIPDLVWHFVAKHARRLGREIEAISARVMQYLVGRDWPGNVRELENWVERALILSRGRTIEWEPDADRAGDGMGRSAPRVSAGSKRLEDVERQHIRTVLEELDGRIEGEDGAAAVLGLRPSTLRSRMKKLGIGRPRGS